MKYTKIPDSIAYALEVVDEKLAQELCKRFLSSDEKTQQDIIAFVSNEMVQDDIYDKKQKHLGL